MTRTVLAALGSAAVLALTSGCSLSEQATSSQDAAASGSGSPSAEPTPTESPSPTPSESSSPTASASAEPTPSGTASPSSSPTGSPSPSASSSPSSTPPSPSASATAGGGAGTDGQATRTRLAALTPGDFFVDDALLEIRDVCRTGSRSFELFLEDGSRFYFDLLRGGSEIKDGQIFDPTSFEDIRQVSPLATNRGEAPRVRVAGVPMRSDAGYEFDVAFLVNTSDRNFCGE